MSDSSGKHSLRQRIRRVRVARTDAQDRAASATITRRLLNDPVFVAARSVAAFVGIAGEPDTRQILEAALEANKTLWLPRVLDGRGGQSELVVVTSLDVLETRSFGLREPRFEAGQRVCAAITEDLGIDLVVVPGLAFGRDGARLGHGPGHYDRLLQPVAGVRLPRRYGMCFADFIEPFDEAIPVLSHDVPMHAVVTEREKISCG